MGSQAMTGALLKKGECIPKSSMWKSCDMCIIGYGPYDGFDIGVEPVRDEVIENGRPLEAYSAIYGGGTMPLEDIKRDSWR